MGETTTKAQRMPAGLAAAALSAGTSIFSNIYNVRQQQKMNQQQQQFSLDMYNRQRQDSLADWAAQNYYNSPAQQMQRLKDAGLNPNMVYGNGNATMPSASVRSSSVESWNPKAPNIDLQGLGNSIFAALDVQAKAAQVDNLAAQNEILHQEVLLKKAQTEATLANAGLSNFNLQFKKDTRPFDFSLKQMSPDFMRDRQDLINQQQMNLWDSNRREWYKVKYLEDNNKRAWLQYQNVTIPLKNASIAKTAADIVLKQAQTGEVNANKDRIRQAIKNLEQDERIKAAQAQLNEMGLSWNDKLWQRMLIMGVQKLKSKL